MPAPHPALVAVAAGRPLPDARNPVEVVRSAVPHGMRGLLLAAIQRSGSDCWAPVIPTLRAHRIRTAATHRVLWAAAADVTSRLADIGIDVAMAKGVAAEARWYEFLGERPSSDVDLLIAPQHAHRIDDAIEALEPSHPLLGRTAALARHDHLQSIDLRVDEVAIDLHWDLLKLGVPSRGRELLWERIVPLSTPDGRTIQVIDAEASFLHFLVHLNKDQFGRLLNYVDIARIAEREDLDHGVVDRLAAADGITGSVAASWNVVVDALDLDRPRRPEPPSLRRAVWHIAWRPSVRLQGPDAKSRARQRRWLLSLLANRRAIDAVRGFGRSILPPKVLVAYHHSPYAVRWGDAFVEQDQSYLAALTVGRARIRQSRRKARAGGVTLP